MYKKLLVLAAAALAMVGCGGKKGPTEHTATLTAANVLGYNPTAEVEDERNVVYGDSEAAVEVEGVTVSWVGIGCYGDSTVDEVKTWDETGWFQMRKNSNSKLNFSVEGTLKSVTLTLATRKSNYDATKPLKWTVGEETGTVDFVKDTADVALPFEGQEASSGSFEYDVDDDYSYTVYVDHVTVVYLA